MLKFVNLTEEEARAVNEVFREIPSAAKAINATFIIHDCEKGYALSRRGETGAVWRSDRRSLLRAVATVAEMGEREHYDLREQPAYEILGAMPDASRNAVPTVETLKKYFRVLALEGYNAVMLYTEDTYELDGYPYFGHLRGRYTHAELRELDDYAALLGLELVPCIQTLAHLNAFFEWPLSAPLRDCNDILLAGEEKVYEMIDSMLAGMARDLRSRKINVGLDEAFLLGAGQYLDRNGFKPRHEIMEAHLARVSELCRRHGYEPRMWSDMFFRMLNKGVYRVKGTVIPPEIANSVPENMTLVYWDYSQPDEASYNEMFRQHRAFPNRIAFAGGDNTWYGAVPLNRFSQTCAVAAARSLRANDIREVWVTQWGDDGGACSLFSSLTTMFLYAEGCWDSVENMEARMAARLGAAVGVPAEAMLDLDRINDLPGRERFGLTPANPTKYMFYENILTGKFAAHTPDGSGAHFAAEAERLAAEREQAGDYGYIWETLEALCRVLAVKTDLAKDLKTAYDAGDRVAVADLMGKIPDLAERVRAFRQALRRQWLRENKTAGWDVMDIRVGGLVAELDTAVLLLREWVNGERERIDELEAPRLPYDSKWAKGYDNGVLCVNRWQRIAAQNLSDLNGF